MTDPTITCKRCGSPVPVPPAPAPPVLPPAPVGRLRCDGCAADLGPVERARQYLERRAKG